MRCSATLIAAAMIAIGATVPANADAIISGPGCAVDGNKIQVGSKLKDGKCWGGINVLLHGSIANPVGDHCTSSAGEKWSCGLAAKLALSKLMRQHSITCYHLDGEFNNELPVVTCISGRRDLALELVRQGMAKAAHDESRRYELEEADAREAKRGIWK